MTETMVMRMSDASSPHAAGGRVIAFLVPHPQVRPLFRDNGDFDFAPLPIAVRVGRGVADAVLVAKFDRDAGREVFQFGGRAREEGFAASNLRDLLQSRLTLHVQCSASRSANFGDPYAINLHAGLLEQLSQFVEGVARRIVLTVGDQ